MARTSNAASVPTTSMEGKYCIVTGSNSGIGLQVVRGLMSRGAHVVMACRNRTACEDAARLLREEGLPGSCTCRVVDLEDPSSIRAFARQQGAELGGEAAGSRGPSSSAPSLMSAPAPTEPSTVAVPTANAKQSHTGPQQDLEEPNQHQQQQQQRLRLRAESEAGPEANAGGQEAAAAGTQGTRAGDRASRRIDVLVNNAGVMGVAPAPDGTDRHLTANHLGPYLLTRLLLPHMTHGSRIVNVASRAHYGGSLSLVSKPPGAEAIKDDTHHWWFQYARSKLCNVLFTAELQRLYGYGTTGGAGSGGGGGGPRGVGAYAVSPGLVDTGIFRYLLPGWAQWLRAPLRPFFRTPQQGAEVVLYAASSPDLQGREVLFLHDCREMTPSAAARDADLAADLWRVSAALVGLPLEDD